MSDVVYEADRRNTKPWPVVARLDCGHFETFTRDACPVLHALVRCPRCPRIAEVIGTVSVEDLVRLTFGVDG